MRRFSLERVSEDALQPATGDIRTGSADKQIVTSVADGAIAAISAADDLAGMQQPASQLFLASG